MFIDRIASAEAALKPVSYARVGYVSDAFQRWRICPLSVEEVLSRLRSAIESADFWNLHEIDPQALLSQEGYASTGTFDSENWHAPYIQGDTMQLLAAAPAELGSQTPAPPANDPQVQ